MALDVGVLGILIVRILHIRLVLNSSWKLSQTPWLSYGISVVHVGCGMTKIPVPDETIRGPLQLIPQCWPRRGQDETTLNRAECIKRLVYSNKEKDLSMKSFCINDHESYSLRGSVLATWIKNHMQAAQSECTVRRKHKSRCGWNRSCHKAGHFRQFVKLLILTSRDGLISTRRPYQIKTFVTGCL